MDEPIFERMAILGLGLIGGSFALAACERGLTKTLVAYDPNVQHLAEASEAGIIEQGFSNARDAVDGADAVILAAPVRAILSLLQSIAPVLGKGTFVMDLGSTKVEIVEALNTLPPSVRAVGGHPMAGKEVTGFSAAEPTLFIRAPFALCPTLRTTRVARTLAERVVDSLGAHPLWMDAPTHDAAVASISHLPYLLAATLASVAAPTGPARQLAASGYRDTSRLAVCDPTMMLDILMTNATPIRASLAATRATLDILDTLLAEADEEGLRRWMERARESR